jgi:hypothetical protein
MRSRDGDLRAEREEGKRGQRAEWRTVTKNDDEKEEAQEDGNRAEGDAEKW